MYNKIYIENFGVKLRRKYAFNKILIITALFILITSFIKTIWQYTSKSKHLEEINKFLDAGRAANITLDFIDPFILAHLDQNHPLIKDEACVNLCHGSNSLSFAIYDHDLRDLYKFLEMLSLFRFAFYQFFTADGKLSHLVITHRTVTFHVSALYWNNAGYWRQFSINDVPDLIKFIKELLSRETWSLVNVDRGLQRFNFTKASIDNVDLSIPVDIDKFLEDYKASRFIPCNETRTRIYLSSYPEIQSPGTIQFEQSAEEILAKAKSVLDKLNVPFFIAEGTLLGFYRECKIIPWSKDVDIGIFIEDYKPSIVSAFEDEGFQFYCQYGTLEDSFEQCFMYKGVRLDVFYFYAERSIMWIGGVGPKSGHKFKYSYPTFNLCWTNFLKLKLRIPCQIETHIKTQYGENWFTPINSWNYRRNPKNVKKNGIWSAEDRKRFVLQGRVPG